MRSHTQGAQRTDLYTLYASNHVSWSHSSSTHNRSKTTAALAIRSCTALRMLSTTSAGGSGSSCLYITSTILRRVPASKQDWICSFSLSWRSPSFVRTSPLPLPKAVWLTLRLALCLYATARFIPLEHTACPAKALYNRHLLRLAHALKSLAPLAFQPDTVPH